MNPLPAVVCLLALGLPLSPLTAQVSTVPVGYVSHTLRKGINLLGLTLHSATLRSGQLDSVSGNTLGDAALDNLTPIAGRRYILEITSGPLKGTLQEIDSASIANGTLTTPQNLAVLGLAVGSGYRLRLAPTLEEVFGTISLEKGGVLQAGISSASADLVWVPQGNGSYQKYYLRSVGNRFCAAGTVSPSPNIPLIYADGFIVEKKGVGTAKLTVSGEVKMQGTVSVLEPGLNTLGAVSPVGLNLANSGLDKVLTKAGSPEQADLVWVQFTQGTALAFKKYFLHTDGFWRLSSAAGTDLSSDQAAAVALSSGFMIEKRGNQSQAMLLEVPTSLSN